MQAAQNPLSQLADISTGQSVSLWPLAWGWWLLIAIAVSVFIISAWQLQRYVARRRVKRLALKAISKLVPEIQSTAKELHGILRWACIQYFPEHNVASLYGEKWAQFLSSQVATQAVVSDIVTLEKDLYRTSGDAASRKNIKAVEAWIKAALPPKGERHV
ncbi:DUF4381 domain-containing protein [Glaciecola sp. MH2013]|uniref:DUF4381 domain-containing protein n=1 Tax=Glaciecola sp. MH2013 TaxID=2785524 RepID=UPI00189ED606|nr:DUF4381 domain-containing protein [Glaciecola sp. MH2013]MBF7073268.1 DUF4381 domain-containing protein [Glaciecola sp. MH2013]